VHINKPYMKNSGQGRVSTTWT